jgi:hypothetical protein
MADETVVDQRRDAIQKSVSGPQIASAASTSAAIDRPIGAA